MAPGVSPPRSLPSGRVGVSYNAQLRRTGSARVRTGGRPTARLPYPRRLSARTSQRTNPETRSRAKCAPLPDRYSVLNRKAPHLPVCLAGPDPYPRQMDLSAATRTAAARDQRKPRSRPGWRTWWTMCARSPRATARLTRADIRSRYGTPHQVARIPVARSRGVAILRRLGQGHTGRPITPTYVARPWAGALTRHLRPGHPVCRCAAIGQGRCAPSGLRLAAPVR